MKLSTVFSYAVVGVEARLIHIEVHIANGLPGLSIVGLPEASVRESKDRVRSAIQNAGFEYPARRITVNLAPADLPKFGAGYDLAIAIGILHASDQIKISDFSQYALIGELSLSGQIRSVSGILPIAVKSLEHEKELILPKDNAHELSILNNHNHRCADSLLAVCSHLSRVERLDRIEQRAHSNTRKEKALCLSDVNGQQQAKRALEIAAAGGHSLLMQGPPGTGKTMLASRIPGILPEMTAEEMVEVASIYSVAQIKREPFDQLPFRAPHHTSSPAALVGGGSKPIPGEISLAHRGILFLDELPEFPNKTLEVMRQPMESGEIWVSRAAMKTVFPSRFQLIAAMNPCPCGYAGEPRCHCTSARINRYQNRISGPLLDRIDLHIRLCRPSKLDIQTDRYEEQSQAIRKRVIKARERQHKRQINLNNALSSSETQNILNSNSEIMHMAQTAIEQMGLSMRALHRVLKVALTIADIAEEPIGKAHFLEAISYRQQTVI